MRRALPLLALTACEIEEAPRTLDEAFRGWWDGFATASDEELGVTLRGTLDVIDLAAVTEAPQEGSQQPLTPDAVATLEFTTPAGEPTAAPDPSAARPLYVIDVVACTLDAYQRVLVHDDQKELYGTYDSYARTYLSPKEAFADGTASTLSWEGTIEQDASVLGAYTYTFRTEARRVAVPDDLGLAGPDAIVVRDWLPFPATWTRGNGSFPQDYQLEVWIPVAEGGLLHVYPIWRVLETSLGDMDSDAVASFNLGKMKDWDRRTAELCAAGEPAE